MLIYIKHCSLADKDHKEYKRQYAHTHHKGPNVICVAKDFWGLPLNHFAGLLAHEMGHILMGEKYHPEYMADKAANKFFGIRIKYKDSQHGEFLQYLNEHESYKVMRWAMEYVVVV
ncbi:MAG: hypothetical protein QXT45_06300 [Candidatus Bilamarchaeaceae archaeon]